MYKILRPEFATPLPGTSHNLIDGLSTQHKHEIGGVCPETAYLDKSETSVCKDSLRRFCFMSLEYPAFVLFGRRLELEEVKKRLVFLNRNVGDLISWAAAGVKKQSWTERRVSHYSE